MKKLNRYNCDTSTLEGRKEYRKLQQRDFRVSQKMKFQKFSQILTKIDKEVKM